MIIAYLTIKCSMNLVTSMLNLFLLCLICLLVWFNVWKGNSGFKPGYTKLFILSSEIKDLVKKIPVTAAIAVRKKVVSIGHFSPCFRLQSLQMFDLLEEIKSNYTHWMYWKSEKNRTEPNELNELKYSKSLTQMTSHAHWHILVFTCSDMYQNIHLSHLKLEEKIS